MRRKYFRGLSPPLFASSIPSLIGNPESWRLTVGRCFRWMRHTDQSSFSTPWLKSGHSRPAPLPLCSPVPPFPRSLVPYSRGLQVWGRLPRQCQVLLCRGDSHGTVGERQHPARHVRRGDPESRKTLPVRWGPILCLVGRFTRVVPVQACQDALPTSCRNPKALLSISIDGIDFRWWRRSPSFFQTPKTGGAWNREP